MTIVALIILFFGGCFLAGWNCKLQDRIYMIIAGRMEADRTIHSLEGRIRKMEKVLKNHLDVEKPTK